MEEETPEVVWMILEHSMMVLSAMTRTCYRTKA